jgi:class 3 adenylate cyclase
VGIGMATGTALATNMGSTNCDISRWPVTASTSPRRLQGKAASGEILVTAEAYKPISGGFADASRVEYLLKAISHPVAAHRLFRGPERDDVTVSTESGSALHTKLLRKY